MEPCTITFPAILEMEICCHAGCILANCIAMDCFRSALLTCRLQHIAMVVGMQAMQIIQVACIG